MEFSGMAFWGCGSFFLCLDMTIGRSTGRILYLETKDKDDDDADDEMFGS